MVFLKKAYYPFMIRKNAFGQKKNKPELKFNPGLTQIGPRTTGPSSLERCGL